MNFMTYEAVRKWFTKEGEKSPSVVRRLAAGAISGAVAQTCTYPLYAIPKLLTRLLLTLTVMF